MDILIGWFCRKQAGFVGIKEYCGKEKILGFLALNFNIITGLTHKVTLKLHLKI
jgi:hypothetical protein